jgi:hypothetical protein
MFTPRISVVVIEIELSKRQGFPHNSGLSDSKILTFNYGDIQLRVHQYYCHVKSLALKHA